MDDEAGAAAPSAPRAMFRRVQRALCHEIWNVGLVAQSVQDIALNGITEPVQWWPERRRSEMLADPAWLPAGGGGGAVLAEFLDYRVGRGALWRAELPPGTAPHQAPFRPFLDVPFHLSYPSVFTDDAGELHIAAEGWQSGGVPLWRLGSGSPVASGQCLAGSRVVDPTLFRCGGRWFLFCTMADHDPDNGLFIFHSNAPTGHWQPLPCNPVRNGRRGSRPAGPIFMMNGVPIRPGQDCTETYGGAVILHRITRLDPLGYVEEPFRRLPPPRGRYHAGLHTICPAGAHTLIDAKRWQPAPLKPVAQLIARLHSQ